MFPIEIHTDLKYYVYLYIDPRDGEIFYVGKGKGNRAFAHLSEMRESDKVKRIADIRECGKTPTIEILAHGLETDADAYHIERAAIDLLGLGSLTNRVRGHHSSSHGRVTWQEVVAHYRPEPADITEPTMLIKLNFLYYYGVTPAELYDFTRGKWKVGPKRDKVQYAMPVYDSLIKEVYTVAQWFPAGTTYCFTRPDEGPMPGRHEFVGTIAPADIRKRYINRSVAHLFPPGSQNPIRYVNL